MDTDRVCRPVTIQSESASHSIFSVTIYEAEFREKLTKKNDPSIKLSRNHLASIRSGASSGASEQA